MLQPLVKQLTPDQMLWLRSLTRRYPFFGLRSRLLGALPQIPDDITEFQIRRGTKYVAFPSRADLIIKYLYWFGEFDPWVNRVLEILLGPGEIFCDIGANIGDNSLSLYPHIGPSGQLYCFEPVTSLWSALAENLAVNQVSNATIIPKALSATSGVCRVHSPSDQLGQSRLIDSQEIGVEVEMITFDHWLESTNIHDNLVCKIDVEGHELSVLQGMRQALSSGQIGGIVFEHHHLQADQDPIIQFLLQHHYWVARIYRGRFRQLRLIEIGDKSGLQPTSDYVAVRSGSIYETRLSPWRGARSSH